ncbi:MAG: AbrB/MazE/SpoVT family DNA-binding domain-containing protein [Actinobacteria bacterium]|nr:AbrB/MazE/SpoVT family DNA-binding domain-containing protein [Actinomycetota bacterium]
MITKIQKWGNSLGIRLPSVFTKELELKENSSVEIKLADKKIVIEPVEIVQYDLDELLSKVSEENIHEEIIFDGHEGKEIW